MNTLYVCSIVFCVDIRFLVEAQKLQRDNARLEFNRDTILPKHRVPFGLVQQVSRKSCSICYLPTIAAPDFIAPNPKILPICILKSVIIFLLTHLTPSRTLSVCHT